MQATLPALLTQTRRLLPRAQMDSSRHITCILQHGKPLVWGWNAHRLPHVMTKDSLTRISRHSEEHALARLRAARRNTRLDPRNLTVVNFRLTRAGALRYAAPCPQCQTILTRAGFKKIWFTTDEQTLVRWAPHRKAPAA